MEHLSEWTLFEMTICCRFRANEAPVDSCLLENISQFQAFRFVHIHK